MDREARVIGAFVSLAGSLVGGGDVVDLVTMLTEQCTELLDVQSAGLLLADRRGLLRVMAVSSDEAADLEALQVQQAEGPCQDCYRDGTAVSVPDLADAEHRWPQFVPAALAAGFTSVHALPMRLRTDVHGALGLFGASTGHLSDEDLALGQAMADIATVALVQDRARTDRDAVTAQLQTALDTRVVLEQAKGLLAFSGDLEMADAFSALRHYSRDRNLLLASVATSLVERTLAASDVLAHHRARAARPH